MLENPVSKPMKNRTKVEDLGSDMLPGKPISAKLRVSLEKEKKETRKRIIERGIVHFRADQEFMSALLDAAEKLKMAPGTLCRQLVWEYLKSQQPAPKGKIRQPASANAVTEALLKKFEAIDEIRDELLEIRRHLLGGNKQSKTRTR